MDTYAYCSPQSQFRGVPMYHLERLIARTTFEGRKMISPEEDADKVADFLVQNDSDEFCWSLHFTPSFLVRLFHAGFLPICTDLGPPGDPVYCLLPKLHFERAVIDLSCFEFSKRKLRKFLSSQLVIDPSMFAQVAEGCLEQHGMRSWLYPPLRSALADLCSGKFILPPAGPVAVHAVALLDESGTLIAGEIGYSVGKIFTSMTGFYRKSGAGTAQLLSLGAWLKRQGFAVWDLGMDMDYKRDIGARLMSRSAWVDSVRRNRTGKPNVLATRSRVSGLIL